MRRRKERREEEGTGGGGWKEIGGWGRGEEEKEKFKLSGIIFNNVLVDW